MSEQKNTWHARREGKVKWTTYGPDCQLRDPEEVASCYVEDWELDLFDDPEQRVAHYRIEVRDPEGNATLWDVEARVTTKITARPA